ncbi:BTG3 protein-like, partial [Scleropages formosus]
MKKEIAAVVFFLKRLIKKADKLEMEKVEKFVERLTVALQEKYKGHWYPENPSKGQAFRCIRVNKFQQEDPELRRACNESGVLYGEKNFAFTVASFSGDEEDKEEVTKKVTNAVERLVYPSVPVWNLSPRKRSRPGQGLPRHVYKFRPQGKLSHPLRLNGWAPPGP